MATKEAEELALGIERLLQSERLGIVTGWVLGSTFGEKSKYGLRLRVRSGQEFIAYGETPTLVVDAMIAKLAASLQEPPQ